MDILIRHVKLEDLPVVSEVNKSAYGNPSDPYCLRQYYDLLNETYYVAELDGNVVGFCISAVKPRTDEGWIIDLAISKDNQHSGIGRKLLTNALEVLSNLDVKSVFLTVDPKKENAVQLYRSFNFSVVGEEENYFGDGQHRLLMNATI